MKEINNLCPVCIHNKDGSFTFDPQKCPKCRDVSDCASKSSENTTSLFNCLSFEQDWKYE